MITPKRFVITATGALLVCIAGLFIAWNQVRQTDGAAWVNHTNQVIGCTHQLLIMFIDAETGQRGYLITGADYYLKPYDRAAAALPAQISLLRRLVADNRRQQYRLDLLTVAAKTRMDELAETIQMFRDLGKEAAWNVVLTDRGKNSMDEIRSLLNGMQIEETQLLAQRMQSQQRNRINTTLGACGALLLSLLLLFAASQRRQKQKAEILKVDNETKFRNIFEAPPFGILTIDREKKSIFDFNDMMCRSLGYTRQEFSSMHLTDFVALPPEQFQANMEAIEELFSASSAPILFESKYRTKSGDIRDVLVTTVPLQLQGRQYYYSVYQDVTERKRVDTALRESEAQLRKSERVVRSLLETASQGILTVDVEGKIVEANVMALSLFGYIRTDLIGEPVEILLSENLRSRHIAQRAAYAMQPSSRPMGPDIDLMGRRRDGSEFPIEISISHVSGLSMALVSDISARRQSTRERETMIAQLQDALREKVAMLREIHHRVKNNLQIICSLLRMQSEMVVDPKIAAQLSMCQRRVMSMAMIHEELYTHENLSSLDLADYCQKLAADLFSSYAINNLITYRVEATSIRLTIEQAVPCALILNELITNAIKHAYPSGQGEVLIRLLSENECVTMTVSDQGVGMSVQVEGSQTLGMTLVQALANQLDGELEIGTSPGASFTVRFTKLASEPNVAAAVA